MQSLRVYPNPWAAFDRNGTPCGVCPRDPESDGGGPGRFVGARVDTKHTKVLQDFGKMAEHEIRSPIQVTRYEYMGVASVDPELATKLASKDPIELPVTKYYKDRIAEGALLPADAETARAGRRAAFVAPAQVFAARAPKESSAQELPGALPSGLPEAADKEREHPGHDGPMTRVPGNVLDTRGDANAASSAPKRGKKSSKVAEEKSQ